MKGHKHEAWLSNYGKAQKWARKYDILQALERGGGLVKYSNFLPEVRGAVAVLCVLALSYSQRRSLCAHLLNVLLCACVVLVFTHRRLMMTARTPAECYLCVCLCKVLFTHHQLTITVHLLIHRKWQRVSGRTCSPPQTRAGCQPTMTTKTLRTRLCLTPSCRPRRPREWRPSPVSCLSCSQSRCTCFLLQSE